MGILSDYLQARAERNDPEYAARMDHERKRNYALVQAAELANVLPGIIGQSPSDNTQVQQPQQAQQLQQPQQAQQPYVPHPRLQSFESEIHKAAQENGMTPQAVEQMVLQGMDQTPGKQPINPMAEKLQQQVFEPQQPVQSQQLNVPNGSKFLPNPLRGGAGILGQDMDPTRRAYLEAIKQMSASGDPDAVKQAMDMLSKMQESSMQDISRTALQKDLTETDLQPGTVARSNFVKQSLLKPASVTNIDMKTAGMHRMSDADKSDWSITDPGPYFLHPTEGPKPIGQSSQTDDQTKSYIYGSMAPEFHNVLSNLDGVDLKKLGALDITDKVPVVGDIINAMTNSSLSKETQLFGNAAMNFTAAINRRESGATVTPYEWSVAFKRFIPRYGDSPEMLAAKADNRKKEYELMLESGGVRGRQKLKELKDADTSLNTDKPSAKPPKGLDDLLPPGHTWAP